MTILIESEFAGTIPLRKGGCPGKNGWIMGLSERLRGPFLKADQICQKGYSKTST
jgi:hypothetical protein